MMCKLKRKLTLLFLTNSPLGNLEVVILSMGNRNVYFSFGGGPEVTFVLDSICLSFEKDL